MAFLRPDQDSVDGTWLNQGGSNNNLYLSLNEDVASDAEYIQSVVNPVDEVCKIGLSDPAGALSEPFVVRYRYNNAGGAVLTVRLLQGTTEIASWTETDSGWQTKVRTLTTPQFNTMSGVYTDLYVEFKANSTPPDPQLTLNLDFIASGATLDSKITFSRSTVGTYYDSAGVLQTASSNVARFDYDPTTLAPLGLLLEIQKTNVALWCRDLTNAAWTKTSMTAAKNQTGRDGVASSASSLTATGANATCLQAITLASSDRVQSAWVKRLTGSGTIEMTTNGGTNWDAISVTGTWTRFTVPIRTVTNPSVGFRIATSGDAIAVDFVQNESADFGQLAFPTSEIATTTVAVTRGADDAAFTGTNFSSWYNQTEGTVVIEADWLQANVEVLFSIEDSGRSTARFYSGEQGSGHTVAFASGDGNLSTGSVGTILSYTPFKYAAAFKANDCAACFNAGSVGTDTSVTLITAASFSLFYYQYNVGGARRGHYRKLKFYNVRKTNAELQALTT